MPSPFGPYFTLNNFINNYTINIFCDASIQYKGKITNGCYGAIATYNGAIIDQEYRVCTDTTNNNAEIKAIRLGVCIALKYKLSGIPVINIFSDSQISVYGIRDRIYNWKVNPNGKLTGSGNTEIANQEIFIEIMRMIVDNQLNINFYHQKGHVNIHDSNDLINATHVFQASNNVREDVPIEFISYISSMNDAVDKRSRKRLKKFNDNKPKCTDPIFFNTQNFDMYKQMYYDQNKYKIFNNL